MDLTLRERLVHANIQPADFCKLLERTERTLWNWNKNTPQWVLNVIKLYNATQTMPPEWENWYFDRHFIVDPDGNAVKQHHILASRYACTAYESMVGTNRNVLSLKAELEKRIKLHQSHITIKVLSDERTLQEIKVCL